MSKVDVLIRRLDPELPLPQYAHAGDAGADLVAAVDVELAPGERAVVPTGNWRTLPAIAVKSAGDVASPEVVP